MQEQGTNEQLFQDSWCPSEVNNLYAFAVLPQIMSVLQWLNIWKARTSCNKKGWMWKGKVFSQLASEDTVPFEVKLESSWNMLLTMQFLIWNPFFTFSALSFKAWPTQEKQLQLICYFCKLKLGKKFAI